MALSLVTLGNRMRTIRSEKKINLLQVSENLKIPVKFLEQIEEGDLIDSISNSTTILFIKAYLDFLEVDSKDLILQYKECFSVIKRNRTLDECVVKFDRAPRAIDLKISFIVSSMLFVLSYCYFTSKQNVNIESLTEERKMFFSDD